MISSIFLSTYVAAPINYYRQPYYFKETRITALILRISLELGSNMLDSKCNTSTVSFFVDIIITYQNRFVNTFFEKVEIFFFGVVNYATYDLFRSKLTIALRVYAYVRVYL